MIKISELHNYIEYGCSNYDVTVPTQGKLQEGILLQ